VVDGGGLVDERMQNARKQDEISSHFFSSQDTSQPPRHQHKSSHPSTQTADKKIILYEERGRGNSAQNQQQI